MQEDGLGGRVPAIDPVAKRAARRRRAAKVAKTSAGVLLISAGVAGVIAPIVPGIPLLIIGGLMVAPGNPTLQRLRNGLDAVRREVARCSESLRSDLERRYPSSTAAPGRDAVAPPQQDAPTS